MASPRDNENHIPGMSPTAPTTLPNWRMVEGRWQRVATAGVSTSKQKIIVPSQPYSRGGVELLRQPRDASSSGPSLLAAVAPTVIPFVRLPVSVKARPSAAPEKYLHNSKRFCNLIRNLHPTLAPKERSKDFLILAGHHFEEANITYLLNRGLDQSPPTPEEILFSIQHKLPKVEWNDATKAELIENILRDIGEHSMAAEFATFRLESTAKDEEIRMPAATLPMTLATDSELDQAILIASEQLGNDWKFFFRSLGLEERHFCEILRTGDSLPSMCCQAFALWRRRCGRRATMSRLLKGLIRTDSFGIAEKIVTELRLSEFQGLLEENPDATPGVTTPQTSSLPNVTIAQRKELSRPIVKTPARRDSEQSHSTATSLVGPENVSARAMDVATAQIQCAERTTTREEQSVAVSPEDFDVATANGVQVESCRRDLKSARRTPALSSLRVTPFEIENTTDRPHPVTRPPNYRHPAIEMRNVATNDERLISTSFNDMIAKAENVPKNCRHIQFIAVGQTGMGKTKTMNRTFGTMAEEGRPSSKSVTSDVTTYTRVLDREMAECVTAPFKLSFTDTPGLGDSHQRISDDDICDAIRRAILPDATVLLLYFFRTGEKMNSHHIEAIIKLEGAIGKKISAIVLTQSTKKPAFGEFCGPIGDVEVVFDNTKKEIASVDATKTPKALLREYAEEDKAKAIDRSDFELGKDAQGFPWPRKVKRRILTLYHRRKTRKKVKNWFREKLDRKKLPILKIENSHDYHHQRGKFGILQFHTKLGQVIEAEEPSSAFVFSLMTGKEVCSALTTLSKIKTEIISTCGVRPSSAQTRKSTIPAPTDESSAETREARDESSKALWRRLLEFLRRFFSRKKMTTPQEESAV